MLKLHRDSSFTPPESQNCLVGIILILPEAFLTFCKEKYYWPLLWSPWTLHSMYTLCRSHYEPLFREKSRKGPKLNNNSLNRQVTGLTAINVMCCAHCKGQSIISSASYSAGQTIIIGSKGDRNSFLVNLFDMI